MKMRKNDPPFRVYFLTFFLLLIENIGFYGLFMLQYVLIFQKTHLLMSIDQNVLFYLETCVSYIDFIIQGGGYAQTLKKSKLDIVFQDQGYLMKEEVGQF